MLSCDSQGKEFCCRGDPCFSYRLDINRAICLPKRKPIITFSEVVLPFTTIGVAKSSVYAPHTSSRTVALTTLATSSVETATSDIAVSVSKTQLSSPVFPGSASSTGAPDEKKLHSQKLPFQLGLGVGLPTGVILIAGILVLFLWRERRLRKEISELRSRLAFIPYPADSGSANYTTMGFPPQELARRHYSRSRLFAEAPSSFRSRSRPRQEMISLEPAAYELPGRKLSNLPPHG